MKIKQILFTGGAEISTLKTDSLNVKSQSGQQQQWKDQESKVLQDISTSLKDWFDGWYTERPTGRNKYRYRDHIHIRPHIPPPEGSGRFTRGKTGHGKGKYLNLIIIGNRWPLFQTFRRILFARCMYWFFSFDVYGIANSVAMMGQTEEYFLKRMAPKTFSKYF